MPRSPFIARERELKLLQDQWQSPNARLMILYGRRRVGKTRLVTHWIETSGVRAFYWVADPTSSLDQLASFSQALTNFEGLGTAPDNFTYGTWAQAFSQIARLARDKRLVVVLDEFTYMLAVEPGMAGVLQNIWDQTLSQSNLFLILSGSHIGMMQRHLLAYQAPLYGRATSKLQLLPLPFAATGHFFPNYRPDERVAVYAMLGGVPAYWEQLDPNQSLDTNIREQFLGGANLMQDEPRLLLQDFVSEIHNYVAILRAIANGRRTPKEISTTAGLTDKHIGMYLRNLVNTGFVERRVPVTGNETSRSGRHSITDPFLRFYYRFLTHRQTQLALGIQDQTLEELKRHLVDFIGTYTWEELCREWLLRAGGHNRLPFLPDQVGSLWNRQAQIDVVGYNSMEKTMILGECKWDRHPIDWEVMSGLVEKTSKVMPSEGQWNVYYLGFARQGWTDSARQLASQVASGNWKGENWRAVGMQVLDLDQVDEDLATWTV
jgi:AAA+ ATPase superfamily predicted ATPase